MPPILVPATSDTLLADGIAAIRSSGTSLSPPARVFFDVALNAATVSGRALSESLSVSVAQILQNVPVVAQVAGMFLGVILAAFDAVEASRAKAKAERAEACSETNHERALKPSGSQLAGCRECPCDVFARNLTWGGITYPDGAPAFFRSLLGEALVCATEGSEFDESPEQLAERRRHGVYVSEDAALRERVRYDAVIRFRRYAPAQMQWFGVKPNPRAGVPVARRALFRRVRRAIEAQYVPESERGVRYTDGGVALWPSYLDLLLREFEEGHLDASTIALNIDTVFHGAIYHHTSSGECFVQQLQLPTAIEKMRKGWWDTLHPATYEGQRVLEELRARAGKTRDGGRITLALIGGAGALAVARPDLFTVAITRLSELLRR